jgi:hypothetical protein
MAHVNLHLAVGRAAGGAITAVPVARAWAAGRPLTSPVIRTIAASFALAFWAAAPNGVTSLGGPAEIHRAWWANVFLGHAAIDARIDGGKLLGELAFAAYLVALYLLVLLAILRARRRGATSPR